ncbi:MAG: type 1 glutamine amidotransferase [Pseudomonadota bacterium]
MKLGLLDAVPPEYEGVTDKSDPEYFRELFGAAVDDTAKMPAYVASAGELPAELDECDAYLITGSPRSVYEDVVWIHQLQDFVQRCFDAGKPLVGICFGHQLIAQALGGKVQHAEQGWLLGLNAIQVREQMSWMSSYQQDCALYYFNHDQVVELPPGATLLAGSDLCPNGMYTIGSKVLSLQPHPEHVRASIVAFLHEIRDRLTPEEFSKAEDSLDQGAPDAALFGAWIWQFLLDAKG